MVVIMTVWFTADLHLGHPNIIGYSGDRSPASTP